MVDSEIQRAIDNFKHKAQPVSADDMTPATVGDINRLIKAIIKLFKFFARS